MSEAGIGKAFEIVCPSCGTLQNAANTSIIVRKYLLDDIGRDKIKSTKCQGCVKNIVLVVRGVDFRVIAV